MTAQRRITDHLRRSVRDVLLRDWDPIGVSEIAEADNEYDSYVTGVCRLLIAHADTQRVVQHLANIEKNSMGLARTSPHLTDVANRLLALVR